ncbi:glycogen/starch/alpha-glucan phosphorylase [Planococcus salinus]|uniref:Alpha-1,4 glucan phosphorylase n=1 Tax=Planococcus salinus TaxID=1848460 RepID=A0A3M8P5X9_9BACL|nr:glycogen/starch/alpha-glucan phosphorylase [Planococcus salinus]RNF39096.1 glycogen/starch/alpha-glucan phosphorylase [Planococcus salinus]
MFHSKEEFKETFRRHLEQRDGKKDHAAAYSVLAGMVRDHVHENWEYTKKLDRQEHKKQLFYFSMEFLVGRMLGQNLQNLKIHDMVEDGLRELGFHLTDLEEMEPEPGLGNGGLGRLAACFLDSLASLEMSGHGYGIRYKGGLFTQHFVDGFQTERPTKWIDETDGWDVRREDLAIEIPFYGEVQISLKDEWSHPTLNNAEWVKAVPYDMPVVGASGKQVNTLRLWQAEPSNQPLPSSKTKDEYLQETEAISDRLYPDDQLDPGKILRLKQQYFLCSASIQTILKNRDFELHEIPEYIAIQINDTHPALAVPELMRVLMDEEGLSWKDAWDITVRTVSYTNHTILEEAMEKWEIRLLRPLLPRIYMIIEEIDRRFKESLESQDMDEKAFHKLSIIDNGIVKMAVLAVVGSYKVNGVAKLHTEILKKRELKELYGQFPTKFHNKTNGITHRRWLLKANPELSELITESIGPEWTKEPERLKELKYFAQSHSFLQDFQAIKRLKKDHLIYHIERTQDIVVNPDSIFDIHIKRFHGYKRQLMNILHVQMLYDRIKRDASYRPYPRTFFFGGKAAPSYHFAKQVIKMINTVAEKVNNDPLAKQHLHIVFVEDYNVSHAEYMIPAAEVSEQISTASKEASGTGNMKFMMNGALTLGTVDGANVEIFEQAGEENAFLFGLRSEEVMRYEKDGNYHAKEIIQQNPEIEQLMEELINGDLTGGKQHGSFIAQQLLDDNDPFFVLEDIQSYAAAHERIVEAYQDSSKWLEMAVKNVAASGIFSSDRTIQQYSDEVWQLQRSLRKTGV